MKKVSRKMFSSLAASMILAGAFVSCANGSDDSTSSNSAAGPTAALSESATVSEVAEVATAGISATKNENTATLTASNGTYVLTAGSQTQTQTQTQAVLLPEKGTWKFTETNATSPKYMGSYTGDITTIGSSETALTLKVEKVLNNGLLSAVVDEKDISMTVPASETFEATIPAVKVSSVTSYMSSKMDVQYSSATNYNIYSNNERIDLADGKITYNAVASRKNLTDGTSAGGNLATNEGVAFYLMSGSYKLYANCVSVADGNNSYAQ